MFLCENTDILFIYLFIYLLYLLFIYYLLSSDSFVFKDILYDFTWKHKTGNILQTDTIKMFFAALFNMFLMFSDQSTLQQSGDAYSC